MIKIYSATYYVSIDGADWREVHHKYMASDIEPKDTLIIDNLSFAEAYDILSQHPLHGIRCEKTCFTKKPIIYIDYADAWYDVDYKNFKTISYKREYEEEDVSLDWIIKRLPADQCIQYLKERGITSCPILK